MKNRVFFLSMALTFLFSYAAPWCPQQKASAQTTADKKLEMTLRDYVGRYEADPTMVENFVFDVDLEGDELWIKPSHEGKRKLAAKAVDTFVITGQEIPVKFNRDAKGTITSLTIEPSPTSGERALNARRLALPTASLKGNTTFHLKGYAGAKVVALAGSFNDWNQSQLLFGKEGDGWVCRVDLAPGRYTYKFIVDGNWILDPDNPTAEEDERGLSNSVLVVKPK